MTNKEAIRILGNLKLYHDDDNENYEALDLAIKALNTMPFIHDMNNTIDRLKARIKELEQSEVKPVYTVTSNTFVEGARMEAEK